MSYLETLSMGYDQKRLDRKINSICPMSYEFEQILIELDRWLFERPRTLLYFRLFFIEKYDFKSILPQHFLQGKSVSKGKNGNQNMT